MIEIHRKTKETDIKVALDMNSKDSAEQQTDLPFFSHMLKAMSFHGGFYLKVDAKGDTDVDPHHLVEDTGLVIGQALEKFRLKSNGISRYGQSTIPMDDALGSAAIDACGRPFLVFQADWVQPRAGDFDLSLIREFWQGLASAARINVHLKVHYSQNAHHAVEALFKAAGRALAQAHVLSNGGEAAMSTKGKI